MAQWGFVVGVAARERRYRHAEARMAHLVQKEFPIGPNVKNWRIDSSKDQSPNLA